VSDQPVNVGWTTGGVTGGVGAEHERPETASPFTNDGTDNGPVLLTGRSALAVTDALPMLASRNRFRGFMAGAYARL
jgi:hypothetical protein